MSYLAVIAAGLGILGALLVAFRRPLAGHVVWCVGNPVWIAWGYLVGERAVVTQFAVYTVLAALGAWNWSRKDRKPMTHNEFVEYLRREARR